MEYRAAHRGRVACIGPEANKRIEIMPLKKIYILSKRVVVLAFEKSATVERLFSVVGITSQTIGSAATVVQKFETEPYLNI